MKTGLGVHRVGDAENEVRALAFCFRRGQGEKEGEKGRSMKFHILGDEVTEVDQVACRG